MQPLTIENKKRKFCDLEDNKEKKDIIFDYIKIISLEKLHKLLEENFSSPKKALRRLQSVCSLIKVDDAQLIKRYRRLWIEIREGSIRGNAHPIWLDMLIVKEKFKHYINIEEYGDYPRKIISATYDARDNRISGDIFSGIDFSRKDSRDLASRIERFITQRESQSDFSGEILSAEGVERIISRSKLNYRTRLRSFKGLCGVTREENNPCHKLLIEQEKDEILRVIIKEAVKDHHEITFFRLSEKSKPLAVLHLDGDGNGSVSYAEGETPSTVTKIISYLLRDSFPGKTGKSDLDFAEFKALLKENGLSLERAWNRLAAISSSKDRSRFELMVKVAENEVFNICFSQDKYFSTSLSEKELYPRNEAFRLYYYLKVFQNNDFDSPALSMRFDLNGNAELIWLKKTISQSGNDMKKLAYIFAQYFGIEKIFLQDDARIKLKVEPLSSRDCHLPFNKSVYLSTIKILASENGDTWYTSDGFRPLKCRNLSLFGKEERANQHPDLYFAAVEHVREMKLAKLCYSIFPECAFLIGDLRAKYCPSIAFEDATLHDLIKSMRGELIKNIGRSKEINVDFVFFYEHLLEPDKRTRANPERSVWNLALEVINEHFIFVKDLAALKGGQYRDFICGDHKKFVDIAGCPRTGELNYEKLIEHVFA